MPHLKHVRIYIYIFYLFQYTIYTTNYQYLFQNSLKLIVMIYLAFL